MTMFYLAFAAISALMAAEAIAAREPGEYSRHALAWVALATMFVGLAVVEILSEGQG